MSKHHNQDNHSENLILFNYPSFSFEFLTKQSEFNFDYFKNDSQSENEAKAALIDKFLLLSSEDWMSLEHLNKRTGFELLPTKEIKINLNHLPFEKPQKLFVFRFDKQRFRLIGFKRNNNPVLYILGFDFDYDAYNHG